LRPNNAVSYCAMQHHNVSFNVIYIALQWRPGAVANIAATAILRLHHSPNLKVETLILYI